VEFGGFGTDGERGGRPPRRRLHAVDFIGELSRATPAGAGLSKKYSSNSGDRVLAENVTVNHQFSSKPVVTWSLSKLLRQNDGLCQHPGRATPRS